MTTVSRTTRWRMRKGLSKGIGSAYHNPKREYDWNKVDYGAVRKIVRASLIKIGLSYASIEDIIDDATQEAIISMASGKTAITGVDRAKVFNKPHIYDMLSNLNESNELKKEYMRLSVT